LTKAIASVFDDRRRQAWPRIRIVVRGDSGFCRPQALRRFEKWGLPCIVGLQRDAALLWRVELAELALADHYQRTGVKQRKIGAAIVRNTRRARVLLASHHPLRHVFISAAHALAP
jgi:hypothetical protein